jgi:hypothetical protein
VTSLPVLVPVVPAAVVVPEPPLPDVVPEPLVVPELVVVVAAPVVVPEPPLLPLLVVLDPPVPKEAVPEELDEEAARPVEPPELEDVDEPFGTSAGTSLASWASLHAASPIIARQQYPHPNRIHLSHTHDPGV